MVVLGCLEKEFCFFFLGKIKALFKLTLKNQKLFLKHNENFSTCLANIVLFP